MFCACKQHACKRALSNRVHHASQHACMLMMFIAMGQLASTKARQDQQCLTSGVARGATCRAFLPSHMLDCVHGRCIGIQMHEYTQDAVISSLAKLTRKHTNRTNDQRRLGHIHGAIRLQMLNSSRYSMNTRGHKTTARNAD